MLTSFLKRRTGRGWSFTIDSNGGIKGQNFTCHWTTYRSVSTGKEVDFCVFPFKDVISDSVKRVHRWGDCLSLPGLWDNATKRKNSVYVEIGANQGTCVTEMLLSTDAKIIAFEPHPMNLFNLRNTLSRLDATYQRRVLLVPLALGNETEDATIYAAYNNMGNSAVGQFVEDYTNQSAPDAFQFQIRVERLDSILDSNRVHIPLIKMDAQGYECRIMEGLGEQLADQIDNIKFEYARNCLKAHGCKNLLPIFRKYGFDIYKNGKIVVQEQVNFKLADLLAKKNMTVINNTRI
eukprot:CAMPEP_0176477752 /NCGR_PEP_ID=MMETSP0200_2-20121128/805_1 /TAXON_ID=947934 /ORGANISM="Chaetoceros sp., Strain GSL56" /LENGTH=291 /DNA_ID=CAMNT_0017873613 /DNA_START=264 /DNA_END=1139 /DNA_ORIENTATION=+